MRITFWGTRGSLAKPGPDTVRYGGNTSCVQVESDSGTLILLDCGTGAHALGQALTAERDPPLRGHILFSHTHWDHIQGMPFFAPLFAPGNEWDVYGPRGFGESLRETLAGQMQYDYFPVSIEELGSEVNYHCLVEGDFEIGDVRCAARYLNHPALTLGYRLEVDGAVVVYACDHEPHSRELAMEAGKISGQDREHAEFLRDADLVIHDAQYTAADYPNRVGWGHSTVEYAVRICRGVGVRRLALTHHDPMRNDEAVDRMMAELSDGLLRDIEGLEVFAAAEGQQIELRGDREKPRAPIRPETSAMNAIDVDAEHRVLLGIGGDRPEAQTIAQATDADDIEVIREVDAEAIVERFRNDRPALVLLDERADGLAVCRAIRAIGDSHAREVPIVLVGTGSADDDAVTDWLRPPFSTEYARTRIRAWLLRVTCRWARPPEPEDESERLAALRKLGLLDTAPEERFDRVTRLAAALFDVPVALVTLVDANRQWFKSCFGADDQESSREISFCAHAILEPEPLIIPDALSDERFADNPVVVGSPNIRFYAGCPLKTPEGYCVGTLCVVDVRPRELTDRQIRLLQDLAQVIEREMTAETA